MFSDIGLHLTTIFYYDILEQYLTLRFYQYELHTPIDYNVILSAAVSHGQFQNARFVWISKPDVPESSTACPTLNKFRPLAVAYTHEFYNHRCLFSLRDWLSDNMSQLTCMACSTRVLGKAVAMTHLDDVIQFGKVISKSVTRSLRRPTVILLAPQPNLTSLPSGVTPLPVIWASGRLISEYNSTRLQEQLPAVLSCGMKPSSFALASWSHGAFQRI